MIFTQLFFVTALCAEHVYVALLPVSQFPREVSILSIHNANDDQLLLSILETPSRLLVYEALSPVDMLALRASSKSIQKNAREARKLQKFLRKGFQKFKRFVFRKFS